MRVKPKPLTPQPNSKKNNPNQKSKKLNSSQEVAPQKPTTTQNKK
jgi:hypothetical protein